MKLATDKIAHAWTEAALAAVLLVMFGIPAACVWGRTAFLVTLAVIFLALVSVAIGKEIADACDPLHHTSDRWDAVASISGGLVVLLPALLIALARH